MNYLSPSILAADFLNLERDVSECVKNGAQYIHIDVMDGLFVPNITIGFPVIQSLRNRFDCIFDVHLMIVDPQRYIKEFASSGADIITIHYESTNDPEEAIELVHKNLKKAGISIKPSTDIRKIEKLLDTVDTVLVMTVEPGFGGQKFMPTMIEKIKWLRDYRQEHNLKFDIEVDGGITFENVKQVLDAGANVIVVGTAIFGKGMTGENTKSFMKILDI